MTKRYILFSRENRGRKTDGHSGETRCKCGAVCSWSGSLLLLPEESVRVLYVCVVLLLENSCYKKDGALSQKGKLALHRETTDGCAPRNFSIDRNEEQY